MVAFMAQCGAQALGSLDTPLLAKEHPHLHRGLRGQGGAPEANNKSAVSRVCVVEEIVYHN